LEGSKENQIKKTELHNALRAKEGVEMEGILVQQETSRNQTGYIARSLTPHEIAWREDGKDQASRCWLTRRNVSKCINLVGSAVQKIVDALGITRLRN
jgi:hypothetical protein